MQSFQQNPQDPNFVQNPYGFYEKTRNHGPLFYWVDYKMPCAASLMAVNTLLRDRRFGREQPAEFHAPIPAHIKPFMDAESHSMLELEPPAHTRLRGLVLRAFTSRRITAMETELHDLAHHLITAFPDGPFDLLRTFGEQIPVIIIARLLGVPESMSDQLLTWSHDMVAMYQAGRTRQIEDRAVAATQAFSTFLRSYVKKRRDDPSDDLITQLITATADGEKLSEDELVTTCMLLLNAGHEATVHAIGNGVAALLQSGVNIKAALHPNTIDATIEEILRFDPPLHMFTRYASQDINLFGHDFKRGDQVALLLGAANRDPTAFDDPNRFDPARKPVAHTSFGAGRHFCLGAPLARLELKIALTILFDRCPNLKLAALPTFADRFHFHGLNTLMVTP